MDESLQEAARRYSKLLARSGNTGCPLCGHKETYGEKLLKIHEKVEDRMKSSNTSLKKYKKLEAYWDFLRPRVKNIRMRAESTCLNCGIVYVPRDFVYKEDEKLIEINQELEALD